MNHKKLNKMPKAMKIITSTLCVILVFILISNLTIIIKGTLNPDRPPSIFGITTMMVMSGSMSGDAPDHIEVGDLIVAVKTDPDTLKVGDVITYMENGKTTVTHRIIDINEDGTFKTKGDANNAEDTNPVKKDEIIGKFRLRIPKLGDVAMFAQTPSGMLVFIGIPLVAYLLLDMLLRAKDNKKDKKQADADKASKEELERELAELKAKISADENSKE